MRHTKTQAKSTVKEPQHTVIQLEFTPRDEGIQKLYWRGDRWYASFSITGERIPHRITTGTADLSEARRRAQAEFIKLQSRLAQGKPRREITYRFVATKFISELQEELDNRKRYGEFAPNGERLRHPDTLSHKIAFVEKYLIPILGDKEIQAITDKDLSDVKTYYATYWTDGPGKDITEYEVMKNGRMQKIKRRKLGVASRNSVNQLVMVINEIFKYAKNNYATSPKVVKTAYVEADDNARATITTEQWEHMKVIQNARIEKEVRINQKWRLRRILLAFEFAMYSGVRVAELRKVKYKDIKIIPVGNSSTIQIDNVSSKGKKSRSVFCRMEIVKTFEEIKTYRKTDDDNEYLFSSDTNPFAMAKLTDGPQRLLQDAGIWDDGEGGYRTLGSMRHNYAQYMIHNMQPFNLFKLAANMGTSEIQIRKHYAADINMREDIEALAGTPSGLVPTVFDKAAPIAKKPDVNPYIEDAKAFMSAMYEAYGNDFLKFDRDRIKFEAKEQFGDDWNKGLQAEIYKRWSEA